MILLLCTLSPVPSPADEACAANTERPILLSGEKPDTISVVISGPSCATSTLTIRIVSASGVTLYDRSTPFSYFHSVTGNPPYIEPPSLASAEHIAREIASSPESRKVEDLLPYFNGEHDDGVTIRKFVLPEATVLRLREQPRFTPTTGWEAWTELAFDPELSRVVVVAEGWM